MTVIVSQQDVSEVVTVSQHEMGEVMCSVSQHEVVTVSQQIREVSVRGESPGASEREVSVRGASEERVSGRAGVNKDSPGTSEEWPQLNSASSISSSITSSLTSLPHFSPLADDISSLDHTPLSRTDHIPKGVPKDTAQDASQEENCTHQGEDLSPATNEAQQATPTSKDPAAATRQ